MSVLFRNMGRKLGLICMMLALSLVLAVPAFAQTADLGSAASGAATTGVGYAVAAAAIIIVFTAGYKLIKKVVGG